MTKILLVDDMKNFLDLEISFLQRADCQILVAKDGAEALKLAKMEKPDIILLDLEMPRMNGIECLRFIKTDPELKATPSVIVTATDKKAECLRAGADDFVKKPINEDAFIREIKKFVDIKERKENRVEASVKVDYTFKKKEYTAYSRDLSASGIFLITSDILPLGSIMPLVVHLSDGKVPKRIKTRGKVVRVIEETTGGYQYTGMGLHFVGLGERASKDLKGFLHKAKQLRV